MTTDRANGSLYSKIEDGIATIEFGHPASNSFISELLERLHKEIVMLSDDTSVHLIVLRSEGDGTFCAGASFNELQSISNLEEGKIFFSGFAHVINAMRKSNKPIIGRAQGKAVGGGVGLLAACDYVFATVDAAVRLSEISIGIAPLVIEPALTRKMGISGFAELALAPTAWKNAYWAKEKGLYAHVFDSIKEMDKELYFFVSKMAQYHPNALENLKKVMWEGTAHWDELLIKRAEKSGELALSPFSKQALKKLKK